MKKPNAKKRVAPKATKPFKIIVEKHPDGYVAYPLGLKGAVIAEGDTYEEGAGRCDVLRSVFTSNRLEATY